MEKRPNEIGMWNVIAVVVTYGCRKSFLRGYRERRRRARCPDCTLSRIRNVERNWSKVERRIPHVDVKYQVLRDYVHTYNCIKGHKPLEPSHMLTMRHTRIHVHLDSHRHRHVNTYRMRKTKKITHSINCVLWTDWFCFIKLTDQTRDDVMKGRMSKVVYVRECPLYSVFWNVSIKCYILCTLVLHFIMHTRDKNAIREKSRNVIFSNSTKI